MQNMKFEVKGTFMIGDAWHPYCKVIEAPNAAQAKERTFTVFGSKHNLKRRYITVNTIDPVNGE
jgi:large subunit ribosomal protein LX